MAEEVKQEELNYKFYIRRERNETSEAKAVAEIEKLTSNYLDYRKNRISLIATENITSKLVKTSYLLGLCDQYCSRIPVDRDKVGNLSFGYLDALDDVNYATRELLKEMFHAPECEARLLSGVNGLTVLLYSLLDRDDVLLKMSDQCGGHLSVKPIAEKVGAQVVELEYNNDYVLDIEDFKRKYFKYKPKVIFLDSSYILFQYPVKEIKEIVKDDAIIVYDASHVISYIANGTFQDPLLEGADIIHSTMHKIMFGPQKAVLLFKKKDQLSQMMMDNVKDVLVSNTHLHDMLALYIALMEFKTFGKDYTCKLLCNNKYLAECMDNCGFDVIGRELGYTESNQFWVRFANEQESIDAFKKLEKYAISTNVIFLPQDQWGLRLGTNELTRLGAGKEFMEELAELMDCIVHEKKSTDELEKMRDRLIAKLDYNRNQFSFDGTKEGNMLMNQIIKRFMNK